MIERSGPAVIEIYAHCNFIVPVGFKRVYFIFGNPRYKSYSGIFIKRIFGIFSYAGHVKRIDAVNFPISAFQRIAVI